MTISFAIALFNGFLTLNFLRVFINSKIAPKIAMEVHESDEDGDNTPNYGICTKIWLSSEAIEIMLDVLIVNQV